jgi:hypothetical protein
MTQAGCTLSTKALIFTTSLRLAKKSKWTRVSEKLSLGGEILGDCPHDGA